MTAAPSLRLRSAMARVLARPVEYSRPDIVILRSIIEASDQIRDELKAIGDEKRYHAALRVIHTRGLNIANYSRELLDRFEAAGEDARPAMQTAEEEGAL